MIMMRLLLVSLFVLAVNNVFAQFSITSQKQAALIRDATLVVVLEEESPKQLKKLAKRGEEQLANYRIQLAGRNKALTEAVKEYWTLSDEILIKTYDEIEELIDQGDKEYVMIEFGKHLDYEYHKSNFSYNGKPVGWTRTGGTLLYNPATKFTKLANEICTVEIFYNGKSLTKAYLPNLSPSKAEAVYGIKVLQYQLNYLLASPDNRITGFVKHIKANNKDLANVTLLIDEDEIDPELNESEIKKHYPFPFEIVDLEKITEAILNENSDYAYVKIVATPTGKGNVFMHTLTGAGDGKLYSILVPRLAIGIKGSSLIKYNQRIKTKQLEKYIKDM